MSPKGLYFPAKPALRYSSERWGLPSSTSVTTYIENDGGFLSLGLLLKTETLGSPQAAPIIHYNRKEQF